MFAILVVNLIKTRLSGIWSNCCLKNKVASLKSKNPINFSDSFKN